MATAFKAMLPIPVFQIFVGCCQEEGHAVVICKVGQDCHYFVAPPLTAYVFWNFDVFDLDFFGRFAILQIDNNTVRNTGFVDSGKRTVNEPLVFGLSRFDQIDELSHQVFSRCFRILVDENGL